MGDPFDMEQLTSIAKKLWDFSWQTRQILCDAIHKEVYPNIAIQNGMDQMDWSQVTNSYEAKMFSF